MNTTWGRLDGSTDQFAIDLKLIADPDPSESVDSDESASWGSLQIWVNGRNLLAHTEVGEPLTSCHWYLLPICEWLVSNWDAVLHEERLPGPDILDASTGIERLAEQRLVPDENEDLLDEQVRAWWRRHNLSYGAMGSVLPPLFLRRWGDMIEFSMSARATPGVPSHVQFLGHLVERVPVSAVVGPLLDALRGISHELVRRSPDSARYASLRTEIDALKSPDRIPARLQLLSGLPNGFEFPSAPLMPAVTDVKYFDFAIEHAPPLALLFGSLAPSVSEADVDAVVELVRRLPEGESSIPDMSPSVGGIGSLVPGPEGSALGEESWLKLANTLSTDPVDIRGVLQKLGIAIAALPLSDPNVRSACVLDRRRAIVALNPQFSHGSAEAVQRFSLAHELCHLLFDQGRAVSLAVASGPWAPKDIEQRANAFAAAFLMPQPLVQILLARSVEGGPRQIAESIARDLNVPFSSAIDRLRNLGVLSDADADALKAP